MAVIMLTIIAGINEARLFAITSSNAVIFVDNMPSIVLFSFSPTNDDAAVTLLIRLGMIRYIGI